MLSGMEMCPLPELETRLRGGEGQILTLNSAVTFSSVLTNVGTAVMEINFF